MNQVPERYRGVWVRTLLQTPQLRDDTTFVRWMQTSVWHADLRIPHPVRDAEAWTLLARQQGFCGITQVSQVGLQAEGEVCTWQRRVDFQPPRADADAGVMEFETPDRVIETGIHAPYLEIWDRLPDSTGRYIVLGGLDAAGGDTQARVLVAGRYCMHVRPRRIAWPQATSVGRSLADCVAHHPAIAQELLDFEISFGTLDAGHWTVEQSTLPGLVGTRVPCVLRRVQDGVAQVDGGFATGPWQVLEWSCAQPQV